MSDTILGARDSAMNKRKSILMQINLLIQEVGVANIMKYLLISSYFLKFQKKKINKCQRDKRKIGREGPQEVCLIGKRN